MPFKQEPQRFAAKINTLSFGSGENVLTLGGENVLPFYTFDAPIENRPRVGVAVSDMGLYMDAPAIKS